MNLREFGKGKERREVLQLLFDEINEIGTKVPEFLQLSLDFGQVLLCFCVFFPERFRVLLHFFQFFFRLSELFFLFSKLLHLFLH